MLKYVEECKKSNVRGNKIEYVKCVLRGIKDNENKEKVVRRATKALLELSKDPECFVSRGDILSQAGFKRYNGPSSGLWPWLEKNADVIEKAKDSRAYRVRKEFRLAMAQVRPAIEQGLSSGS
jgi:hypothetical protein